MIGILLSQVKAVHFIASPHFKLASTQTLYSKAQAAADQRREEWTGHLAPLIADGDPIQTLNQILTTMDS